MEKIIQPDNYTDTEDEYCVKLGRDVPGGCDVLFCGDIDSCPYVKGSDVIEGL